jgi:serine/threonine protein kinase
MIKKALHSPFLPAFPSLCRNFPDEPKIIDLGLAKSVNEPGSQTAISIPGGFAGTPEFASPEQFAGVGVDIRSDLYSLGVMLWEMATGQPLFRGAPAEVMYQHQHAPLPLKQLDDVPQPVVVLLEVLLEKDPGRRFQNPAELLKVMPTIIGAINSRRRLARQSFQKTTVADLRAGTRRPPTRLGPKKISVARLPITGRDVFGREEDIAFLDHAWANQQVNVVQSLPGLASASPRSSTIGSDGWLLNIIVLHSLFSAGPSIGREPVERHPQLMNSLRLLSLGLETKIHGLEQGGRKAKGSPNSSPIAEPY